MHRLVDGELAAERVDALGAHLAMCGQCRGDLGWWLAIKGGLLREWAGRVQLPDHG